MATQEVFNKQLHFDQEMFDLFRKFESLYKYYHTRISDKELFKHLFRLGLREELKYVKKNGSPVDEKELKELEEYYQKYQNQNI